MIVGGFSFRGAVSLVRIAVAVALIVFTFHSPDSCLPRIDDSRSRSIPYKRHTSLRAPGDHQQDVFNVPANLTIALGENSTGNAPAEEVNTLPINDLPANTTTIVTSNATDQIPQSTVSPSCRTLRGAQDVLIILKTGASEVFSRVPEQLLTLAQCAPNLMIFSDLEMDLGDYHMYDCLDEIGEEWRNNHEDFEFYRNVQRYQNEHQDLAALGFDKGWNLDKWKNIPILHKAYQKYPDIKWFVTMDADTYVSWANLLELLSGLNPSIPLYIGSSYCYGDMTFAQGGTGYIISNAAAKLLEDFRTPEWIAKWEKETSTCCCGDVMLAVAFRDAGLNLTSAYPLLQSVTPADVDWSERIWCTPAVTWHHMRPFEIEAMWRFEQDWVKNHGGYGADLYVPYLFRDAFEHFVQPYISINRSDWNNLSQGRSLTKPCPDHEKEGTKWDEYSDEEKETFWNELADIEKRAIESSDDCYAACLADEECLQWFFKPGSCRLDNVVRVGKLADPKKETETISGWMGERIEAFKQKQPDCVPIWDLET